MGVGVPREVGDWGVMVERGEGEEAAEEVMEGEEVWHPVRVGEAEMEGEPDRVSDPAPPPTPLEGEMEGDPEWVEEPPPPSPPPPPPLVKDTEMVGVEECVDDTVEEGVTVAESVGVVVAEVVRTGERRMETVQQAEEEGEGVSVAMAVSKRLVTE